MPTNQPHRVTDLADETLHGTVIAVTDLAVLIETVRGSEVWVPRSVCRDGADLDVGDGDPEVALWWPA